MTPERLFLAELEAHDPHARQGVDRRFLCPFCGDGKPKDGPHRCFAVNTQTGLWKCHRCEQRGKLADFWEERPKLNRREFARQQLRRLTTLPPVEIEAPRQDAEAQRKADELRKQLARLRPLENTTAAYLVARGVSLEIAQQAGATFSPDWYGRPAVVFPIHNRAGERVGAQGRFVDGRDKPCKALTGGPKSQGVFAAAGAFDVPPFIITEAPLDALSLAVAGFPAVALCGKTGPDWLPKFCFRRTVFLGFDADEHGDGGADKLAPSLESFGATCKRLRPEGAKDWNEFLALFGRDELARFITARVF